MIIAHMGAPVIPCEGARLAHMAGQGGSLRCVGIREPWGWENRLGPGAVYVPHGQDVTRDGCMAAGLVRLGRLQRQGQKDIPCRGRHTGQGTVFCGRSAFCFPPCASRGRNPRWCVSGRRAPCGLSCPAFHGGINLAMGATSFHWLRCCPGLFGACRRAPFLLRLPIVAYSLAKVSPSRRPSQL